ncbi:MAG: hypothetical protein IJ916_06420 [Paludibacteraceae bacterium]|nr:hypothetical protein [Paludibacteraceae bacterium]
MMGHKFKNLNVIHKKQCEKLEMSEAGDYEQEATTVTNTITSGSKISQNQLNNMEMKIKSY